MNPLLLPLLAFALSSSLFCFIIYTATRSPRRVRLLAHNARVHAGQQEPADFYDAFGAHKRTGTG